MSNPISRFQNSFRSEQIKANPEMASLYRSRRPVSKLGSAFYVRNLVDIDTLCARIKAASPKSTVTIVDERPHPPAAPAQAPAEKPEVVVTPDDIRKICAGSPDAAKAIAAIAAEFAPPQAVEQKHTAATQVLPKTPAKR